MTEKNLISIPPLLQGETLRARRLEIMDDKGNVRIFADVADGSCRFVLCDERSVRRVIIQTGEPGGAEIGILDENQTPRLGLALTKKGNGLLSFLDIEGTEVYKVEIDRRGQIF